MIGCWISSLVLVLRVRAAAQLGRKFVCVDQNPPAIEVMAKRLGVDPVSFAEYRGCSAWGECAVHAEAYGGCSWRYES